MKDDVRAKLRELPAMERLLEDDRIAKFERCLGRDTVKTVLADVLSTTRRNIIAEEADDVSPSSIYIKAISLMERYAVSSLKTVVNATGVVVHTNLGRSCLAKSVADAVTSVALHYNTLEYNLEQGHRGQRNNHVEWLLCQLTGAEAAIVVNNNAGAVLLCLAALARNRKAIVSRGELVEIGGSFRIPDIMAFAGTRLVEVGATNRTHLKDYVEAIDEDTEMLLKVHPSNFRIIGFQKNVSREDLAVLAHDRGLVFMEDLGSGILLDTSSFGLTGEPTVRQCIESGVDVVTFSGDKLLGGPQIGAVVGRKKYIDKLRTYPLLRALRCDKMTLCAMEETLRLYLRGDWREIPTLRMLSEDLPNLKGRAEDLASRLRKALPTAVVDVVRVEDAVGGGAFPETMLDGYGVSIRDDRWSSAGSFQEALRKSRNPIVTGARENALVFHVRTLLNGDADLIIGALISLCREEGRA